MAKALKVVPYKETMAQEELREHRLRQVALLINYDEALKLLEDLTVGWTLMSADGCYVSNKHLLVLRTMAAGYKAVIPSIVQEKLKERWDYFEKDVKSPLEEAMTNPEKEMVTKKATQLDDDGVWPTLIRNTAPITFRPLIEWEEWTGALGHDWSERTKAGTCVIAIAEDAFYCTACSEVHKQADHLCDRSTTDSWHFGRLMTSSKPVGNNRLLTCFFACCGRPFLRHDGNGWQSFNYHKVKAARGCCRKPRDGDKVTDLAPKQYGLQGTRKLITDPVTVYTDSSTDDDDGSSEGLKATRVNSDEE